MKMCQMFFCLSATPVLWRSLVSVCTVPLMNHMSASPLLSVCVCVWRLRLLRLMFANLQGPQLCASVSAMSGSYFAQSWLE